MSWNLTLGAEEELHLIDLQSRKLVPRAPQILARLPEVGYSAEIQRSTVETNTEVVDSLAGLRAELLRLRRGIVEVAAPEQIAIPGFARNGLSTVDSIDTGAGKLALVALLAGAAKGQYGVEDTATDGVLPPLPRTPA